MIIHNPILTGSFTYNGADISNITSSAAGLTSLNNYTASQNILNGTYATTGSNTFKNPQTINSNLTVTGSITAATLVVQTVTSSVIYSSGSNVFGNSLANTQVFTGSLLTTGSVRFGASNQQTAGTERIYVGQNSAVGIDDANSLSLFVAHAAATGSPQIGFTYQFRQNENTGANLYGDAIRVVKNAGANSTYTIFSTNSTIGAGTERMRIDANGNVSIGATSFTSPSGADTILGVYGGQDCSLILQDAVQLWELYVNDDFYINRGSTNVLTALRSNGNIGIGTSSPSSILDVRTGAGTTGTVLSLQNTTGAAAGNIVPIRFYSGNSFGGLEQIAAIWGINPNAGTNNGGALVFATSANGTSTTPSERMRITSGGALVIGTSTAAFNTPSLQIGGAGSSYFSLYQDYSGTAVGMEMTSNTNVLKIQFFGSSGNYYFAGSNISDRRSKSNIQEIGEGLSKILQLKPSTFVYNTNSHITKGGFIAQEVLEVVPDFVTIPEDETEMMGVDYNSILALAVKAIQELKAEFDDYKATHP